MVRKMELAWNTQKNKMTDVKGKEMEQERKGRIKNDDIDLSRTHLNYDIVQSDKTLYQRVKERVEDLKKSGSRVQKNSVVMYSNVLTVPREQAEKWGEKKTDEYFKACYDFFCREFGTENVVSAVVHKDETSPHMHLHFIPVNKENGRLQARIAMNRQRINQIHNELPKFLQERGFDVERASGKTKDKNIEDVHEYKQVQRKINEKKQELEKEIDSLEKNLKEKKSELQALNEKVPDEIKVQAKREFKQVEVKSEEKNFLGIPKKEIQKKPTGNVIVPEEEFKNLVRAAKENKRLKGSMEKLLNTDLAKENSELQTKLEFVYGEWKRQSDKNKELRVENMELKRENSKLNNRISDLKRDMRLVYLSTRDFLKEHTNGLKAFKSVFKGLIDKVKDKTSQTQEKLNLEPKMNEFEKVHKQELRKERNRGLER